MRADPLSITLLVGVAVFLLWRGRSLATTAIPALRAHSLLIRGEYERALVVVDRLERRQLGTFSANYVCCVLISAGQYRRALAIGNAHQTVDFWWPLLQVNLAEAEYNLGEWEKALARLDLAIEKGNDFDPVTRTGEACQRAWILAHLGRQEEAAAAHARAAVDHLPAEYASEYHFTRGYLALLKGHAAEALAAIDEGRRLAVRVSTHRNGLFLRARALALAGDTEAALAEFERGANHEYKYQGGDGLLAWGDLLFRLGRPDDADRAWRLAVERDPESESAIVAQKRLGELAAQVAPS